MNSETKGRLSERSKEADLSSVMQTHAWVRTPHLPLFYPVDSSAGRASDCSRFFKGNYISLTMLSEGRWFDSGSTDFFYLGIR